MNSERIATWLVLLCLSGVARGQDFNTRSAYLPPDDAVAASEDDSEVITGGKYDLLLAATHLDRTRGDSDHACSCCDCLLCRETLTGDWNGRRTGLAQHGILVKSSLTQFYQGVASGGEEQRFRYGDKFDLYVDFQTEQLGLWKGGNLQIHAVDWNFGQNSIADAAFLAPVNANMILPAPREFAVSTFMYQQQLGHGFAAMVGRYSLLDLWEGFYPDYGKGLDGFMNVSNIIPFNVIIPPIPPVSNLAGIVKAGERGLQYGFLAFDSTFTPTTVGAKFPNGVTLLGFGRRYTDFGGLPGSHTVAGIYATGDFTDLDPNGWLVIPPGRIIAPIVGEQTGTWAAAYIGEQRLWQDPCNTGRYTNLRGMVGFGDAQSSPYSVSAALTLEAFGRVQSRPRDRMGIGYFYNRLNNAFRDVLAVAGPAGDVHGGEVYYNAEITPWFHLTLNLQAINPVFRDLDTAFVIGLRGKLDF